VKSLVKETEFGECLPSLRPNSFVYPAAV